MAFSVAVITVWVGFLVVAATTFNSPSQFEKILLVFSGFVLGWFTATWPVTSLRLRKRSIDTLISSRRSPS
jgi:hypothetical protein